MNLTIKRVRQQGREIRSIAMLPEEVEADGHHRIEFTPGQVAVLRAGDEQPAYFALTSAPEDKELEFLIKRSGTSAEKLYTMCPDERVELVQITGKGFPLHSLANRDLVFVAMGTGVAPLRSALRSALAHPDDFGRLVVLYGARTPDDFCYLDETDDWRARGVELRQVISQPLGYDWSGPTGYVQSLLDNLLHTLDAPTALLCGSREMIAQTRERLEKMGLAPEQILTNY